MTGGVFEFLILGAACGKKKPQARTLSQIIKKGRVSGMFTRKKKAIGTGMRASCNFEN